MTSSLTRLHVENIDRTESHIFGSTVYAPLITTAVKKWQTDRHNTEIEHMHADITVKRHVLGLQGEVESCHVL